jgi:hypothetical protein
MMRIRGTDSGHSGSGGRENRSDNFRQGRHRGQKVRGTLVKWVSDSMAWVLIDGHHLLAQLQSGPAEGTRLTFIITQLHPEIVLKEITGSSGAGDAVADGLSAATAFETARTIFENRFRRIVDSLTRCRAEDRQSRFISMLADDAALFVSYHDVINCSLQINALSSHSPGAGQIAYQPWLTPRARRQLTSMCAPSAQELAKVVVECETPELGQIRVEFLSKAPTIGYRVKVQHPARVEELKTLLQTSIHPPGATNIQCLGVGKLPRNEHGGILAARLFAS